MATVVRFEITDDARVIAVITNDRDTIRKQVSHLLSSPSPREWEQLQRVLKHTFAAGARSRSREISDLLAGEP